MVCLQGFDPDIIKFQRVRQTAMVGHMIGDAANAFTLPVLTAVCCE